MNAFGKAQESEDMGITATHDWKAVPRPRGKEMQRLVQSPNHEIARAKEVEMGLR